MDNSFIVGGAIAVIYLILKIVEMRLIVKETKPVKDLARDKIIVYLSSILGVFILEQFSSGISNIAPTTAFTGNPDF